MWTRRAFSLTSLCALATPARDWDVEIQQLTKGPKNHFFGYIGHAGNTPWNGNDRLMAFLETERQDRMPGPADPAGIAIVDTADSNRLTVVDQSRGWNPQQGTMFYWNPRAANSELIFNDRDVATNHVFAVRFDVQKRKRIHEYRYKDTPFGNSGVAQKAVISLASTMPEWRVCGR